MRSARKCKVQRIGQVPCGYRIIWAKMGLAKGRGGGGVSSLNWALVLLSARGRNDLRWVWACRRPSSGLGSVRRCVPALQLHGASIHMGALQECAPPPPILGRPAPCLAGGDLQVEHGHSRLTEAASPPCVACCTQYAVCKILGISTLEVE